MTLAPGERAAWLRTVTMSRGGMIAIVAVTVVFAVTAVWLAFTSGELAGVFALLALLFVVLLLATSVFRARVDDTGLTVRSALGIPSWRIPLEDVETVTVAAIDPMTQFGGWGVRAGLDGRFGVVLRRGDAIQVARAGKRTFVVTVDDAVTGAALLGGSRRPSPEVHGHRPGLTHEHGRGLAEAMADPTPDAWQRLDAYFAATLVGSDPDLESAVAEQNAAGLPHIEVAPVNGKLLHLLARIAGAKRVLEIGTLGGYSTIWLARGIPEDGIVISIEAEPRNAEIARANLERAGVGAKVEVRVGRAADVLPTLVDDPPFDLVFIDADKESNTIYLDWAATLGRPGTVVVVDNVGRGGRVADPATVDPQVIGTQRGLELLGRDPRFDATALQTLDAKGWDGVAIALVV